MKCKAVKKDGQRCTYNAQTNGYCGIPSHQNQAKSKKNNESTDINEVIDLMSSLKVSKVIPKATPECFQPCDHFPNPRNRRCIELHDRKKHGLRVREEVLRLFNSTCVYQCHEKCSMKLTAEPRQHNTMWIDHIEPWKKGGYDGIPNLLPACSHCNRKKGTKSVESYCGLRGENCSEFIQDALNGNEKILELKKVSEVTKFKQSGHKSVLYYYIATCGACFEAAQRFEELAELKLYERYQFGKVNAAAVECPQVEKVPYFEVFVAKKVVYSCLGPDLTQLKQAMNNRV